MEQKMTIKEDLKVQRAFNKTSTESLKLIELALENRSAYIYLKGVRNVIDTAIKMLEEKYK